jgi:hypothetical protein
VRRTIGAVLTAAALAAAACSPSGPSDAAGVGGSTEVLELAIAPASFDLAVGSDRRLLLAVFTGERERVVGGEVMVRLAHLGAQRGGSGELGPAVAATWLPVPGLDLPAPDTGPTVATGGLLTGVYAARVDLDRPGFWGVLVEATLTDGRTAAGRATVAVLEAPEVVDVGDTAPTVANVVTADVAAGREPASTLDSRLRDPSERDRAAVLHRVRVPDAIAAARPVVVAIATPVYCQSLVCGPLTEHLLDLAERYADRAEFVHIEVWRDFAAQQLSAPAAAWVRTPTGGNEPWVFLVGADGRIAARWDNVLDAAELERLLAALPAGPPLPVPGGSPSD